MAQSTTRPVPSCSRNAGRFAIGADRGQLVIAEGDLEPLAVAKILKAVIEKENPQLVILGKQAIDYDNDQTGQMLAGLLGWPQATFASNVTIEGDQVHVTREVDGGHQTVRLRLPAIITCDLRLNTPRFAALPSIMKLAEPPRRKAGIKVKSVTELLDKLRNEAGVI